MALFLDLLLNLPKITEYLFVPFVLKKETVEGFNVFKSSKKLAPVVNKENDKEEGGPSKAKKELNRQMEVFFFFLALLFTVIAVFVFLFGSLL